MDSNKKDNKTKPILNTLLSEEQLDDVLKSKNLSIANYEGLNEIIYLINLVEKIAKAYNDELPENDAIEAGLKGLRFGLAKYRDKVLSAGDEVKISAYLSWFIKTAIEFKIGIENEDTKAWANMNA